MLKDNGRDNLVGLEGIVYGLTHHGIIVTLDNDPAVAHRMYVPTGFPKQKDGVPILRFFQLDELEGI